MPSTGLGPGNSAMNTAQSLLLKYSRLNGEDRCEERENRNQYAESYSQERLLWGASVLAGELGTEYVDSEVKFFLPGS